MRLLHKERHLGAISDWGRIEIPTERHSLRGAGRSKERGWGAGRRGGGDFLRGTFRSKASNGSAAPEWGRGAAACLGWQRQALFCGRSGMKSGVAWPMAARCELMMDLLVTKGESQRQFQLGAGEGVAGGLGRAALSVLGCRA